MATPFIGQIMMFAGNFAPKGWSLCNGQLLSIAQNTALFSILGTTYGGDGRVTFALPNLMGRAQMHWGQAPGLSNYDIGQLSGEETVMVLSSEMPAHSHSVQAAAADGNQPSPANNSWSIVQDSVPGASLAYSNAAPAVQMNPQAIGLAGGSQSHNNMQPYLCVTYVIAMEGIFPSRN